MINAIIYDKTPNTNFGQMGGEIRVVGQHYLPPGGQMDDNGNYPILETIVEDMNRDQKVLVLTYNDGMQVMIPDRGVEKILKFQ